MSVQMRQVRAGDFDEILKINAGFKQVVSLNPYWDIRGRTYEDSDGYRIVLQNDDWNNVEEP
jgi:hypothetical protein